MTIYLCNPNLREDTKSKAIAMSEHLYIILLWITIILIIPSYYCFYPGKIQWLDMELHSFLVLWRTEAEKDHSSIMAFQGVVCKWGRSGLV